MLQTSIVQSGENMKYLLLLALAFMLASCASEPKEGDPFNPQYGYDLTPL